MPADYTSDPDFMAAAPSDQMRYLTSVDKDFASASPIDQLGYLAHLRGLGPVQGPQAPISPISPDPASLNMGVRGGSTNELQSRIENTTPETLEAGLGSTAAVGATLAGAPLIPAAARALLPSALSAAKSTAGFAGASALIGGLKNIPGAGQYISKIPGIDYLPMAIGMMSGGANEEQAPPVKRSPIPPLGEYKTYTRPLGVEAENVGQPVAIGKVSNPGPRPNGPYSGPDTPASMIPAQSGMIAKHGYVPETNTGVMEFNNGKVYSYKGLPPEIYDNFRNAESQGSYFAQNIKGRYRTEYRGSVSPTTAGAKARAALGGQ